MDHQALKVFLHETRRKATAVLAEEHIGADVKLVIESLFQICDSFEDLVAQSSGQSADSRMMKKKLDQAKADKKAVEMRVDALKKQVLTLIPEIKNIAGEAAGIAKRHGDPTDPDAGSAGKIKAATQKMAEIVVKTSEVA